MQFVGDLSVEDAKVIVSHGSRSLQILEFGVGGSTQLFAQCMPNCLISVETDSSWVNRVRHCLGLIEKKTPPIFVEYGCHPTNLVYDCIFVDGIDHLRLDFALSVWPLLAVGGVMLFHDTRRALDFQNVAKFLMEYHNEVERVDINVANSNITVLSKKVRADWVWWHAVEGKPSWAYGLGDQWPNQLWSLD